MPIFQDPDQRCKQDTRKPEQREQAGIMRCPTEQKKEEENGEKNGEAQVMDDSAEVTRIESLLRRIDGARMETSDRIELIERIKRGESPTWVPGRALEDYFSNHSDPPQARITKSERRENSSPLLPAVEVKELSRPVSREQEQLGSEIQRPRSALHSGDFREGSPSEDRQEQVDISKNAISQSFSGALGSSPTTPWYSPYTAPSFNRFQNEARYPAPRLDTQPSRSRAPSLGSSLSSSFAFKPPTSPLVHQANNTDLDFSPRTDLMNLSTSPDKASRRRTLPPDTFRSLQSTPQPYSSQTRAPPMRREGSFQAHQPRRSLHSATSFQGDPSPQTPRLRSRAPSYSSDISPLQHASMVGSYEESILRGRMSTTPSKPLDFMAQIGVLGIGDCRASLRCPPHVTVPFPAVFYSYPSTGSRRSSISEDSPSPYVGFIDLEKHAKPEKETSRSRHMSNGHDGPNESHEGSNDLHAGKLRTREKKKRRLETSKAPPGGSYRIPQKGQLQIIIKNPNKSAVKLFLVPYDLDGMEPGTKTFIRQRSYSAGPIIEMPIASANSSPETLNNAKDKPVLRYLIHLNICSPSTGRFYLYQGVRVVFANRVPDDKEKLRNEIQLPEPRYSPYKSTKDVSIGAAGAKLAQEKANRRRSSNFGLGPTAYDAMDGIVTDGVSNFSQPPPVPPLPIASIPFHMSPPSRRHTPPSARHHEMEIDSPPRYSEQLQMSTAPITPPCQTGLARSLISPGLSSSYFSSSSNGSDGYNKLNKGDAGYGGSAFGFTNAGGEAGEGLLAMRLKGLDAKKLEESGGE